MGLRFPSLLRYATMNWGGSADAADYDDFDGGAAAGSFGRCVVCENDSFTVTDVGAVVCDACGTTALAATQSQQEAQEDDDAVYVTYGGRGHKRKMRVTDAEKAERAARRRRAAETRKYGALAEDAQRLGEVDDAPDATPEEMFSAADLLHAYSHLLREQVRAVGRLMGGASGLDADDRAHAGARPVAATPAASGTAGDDDARAANASGGSVELLHRLVGEMWCAFLRGWVASGKPIVRVVNGEITVSSSGVYASVTNDGGSGGAGAGAGSSAPPTTKGSDMLPLTMSLSLGIVYLGCRRCQLPVMACDIVRWARNRAIPYLNAFASLPVPLAWHARVASRFLTPDSVPTIAFVEWTAESLAGSLALQVPPANTRLIGLRLTKAMRLPERVWLQFLRLHALRVATSDEAAGATVARDAKPSAWADARPLLTKVDSPIHPLALLIVALRCFEGWEDFVVASTRPLEAGFDARLQGWPAWPAGEFASSAARASGADTREAPRLPWRRDEIDTVGSSDTTLLAAASTIPTRRLPLSWHKARGDMVDIVRELDTFEGEAVADAGSAGSTGGGDDDGDGDDDGSDHSASDGSDSNSDSDAGSGGDSAEEEKEKTAGDSDAVDVAEDDPTAALLAQQPRSVVVHARAAAAALHDDTVGGEAIGGGAPSSRTKGAAARLGTAARRRGRTEVSAELRLLLEWAASLIEVDAAIVLGALLDLEEWLVMQLRAQPGDGGAHTAGGAAGGGAAGASSGISADA